MQMEMILVIRIKGLMEASMVIDVSNGITLAVKGTYLILYIMLKIRRRLSMGLLHQNDDRWAQAQSL